MVWCSQATSHCLSQCWHRSLSPYGTIRPQRVNVFMAFSKTIFRFILFLFCCWMCMGYNSSLEITLYISISRRTNVCFTYKWANHHKEMFISHGIFLLRAADSYMHQATWSSLVHVIACHLAPLAVSPYWHLDAYNKTSANVNIFFLSFQSLRCPSHW